MNLEKNVQQHIRKCVIVVNGLKYPLNKIMEQNIQRKFILDVISVDHHLRIFGKGFEPLFTLFPSCDIDGGAKSNFLALQFKLFRIEFNPFYITTLVQ